MSRKKGKKSVSRCPTRWKPVLTIISGFALIISTVAITSVWGHRRYQQQLMVRRDLYNLIQAGELFFEEYGMWPSRHSGQYGDFRYGRTFPNAFVLNTLRANNALGNWGHTVNPEKKVFIEVGLAGPGVSGLDAEGNMLDPWGEQYQIVLDTDLDNSCYVEKSVYGHRPGYGVVVWSCGPDRISDTEDDGVSWEK